MGQNLALEFAFRRSDHVLVLSIIKNKTAETGILFPRAAIFRSRE
jgi:hypothetical protein